MHVIVDLCVVPMGVGVSVSKYIAVCERVIRDSGLHSNLHPHGTNIEGEWDDVMAVVKKCHEVLHDMDVIRISSSMRIGTRTDRKQSMLSKVQSVEEKLRSE